MMQSPAADVKPPAENMRFDADEHNSRFLRCVMAEMNLMQRQPTIRKVRVMPAAKLEMAVRRRMLSKP